QKLETADMLLLVHTLSKEELFSLSPRQQHIILLAHHARHGPLDSLLRVLNDSSSKSTESVAAASSSINNNIASLINETYKGFPILFQPLIDCESGWLSRLNALITAGADAEVKYEPWNCSALHMLL